MKWKCRLENIEATDYGSCTKRGRYHFLIFDLKGAMVDQSGKDFKLPSFLGVQVPRSLKYIVIGQGDLQEVLLPEEDDVLIEWLASLRRNEHHEEKKWKNAHWAMAAIDVFQIKRNGGRDTSTSSRTPDWSGHQPWTNT